MHTDRWVVAITLCVFALLQIAVSAHNNVDHVDSHEAENCELCYLADHGGKLPPPSAFVLGNTIPAHVDFMESSESPLKLNVLFAYSSRAPPFLT